MSSAPHSTAAPSSGYARIGAAARGALTRDSAASPLMRVMGLSILAGRQGRLPSRSRRGQRARAGKLVRCWHCLTCRETIYHDDLEHGRAQHDGERIVLIVLVEVERPRQGLGHLSPQIADPPDRLSTWTPTHPRAAHGSRNRRDRTCQHDDAHAATPLGRSRIRGGAGPTAPGVMPGRRGGPGWRSGPGADLWTVLSAVGSVGATSASRPKGCRPG